MIRNCWFTSLWVALGLALGACASTGTPAAQEAPTAAPEPQPQAKAEPDKPLEYYLLVEEDFEDEAADTINEDNVDGQVDALSNELASK